MSGYVPWKIVHLSLDQGIDNLAACPGYRGLHLVFWWRGVVLGHAEVPAGQLPLPAAEVAHIAARWTRSTAAYYLHELAAADPNLNATAANSVAPSVAAQPASKLAAGGVPDYLSRPISDLAKCLELRNTGANPSISVIVCTRNRPQVLSRCLQSLLNQSVRAEQIIVVDNAPVDDATKRLVDTLPDVTYVCEPVPGLSRARNAGLRVASSELVAFTDDDVVADPHWLARIAECFDDATVMAMTGLVLVGELEQESQYYFEQYWKFNRGYRPIRFDREYFQRTLDYAVPVWEIGAGANMAFRREVFDELGGYDELLGAGTSGCGEDSEFWYRILNAGYTIVYEPKAAVHHFHRASMKDLKGQILAYMRGHTVALLRQYARYGHRGNLRRAYRHLPKYYLQQLIRKIPRRGYISPTLFTEIRGWLAGFFYYYRNRPQTIDVPNVTLLDRSAKQSSLVN